VLSLARNVQEQRCAPCWCIAPCVPRVTIIVDNAWNRATTAVTRTLAVRVGSSGDHAGMSAHALQAGRWH